ncbi:polysaccharide deacetylase family protein [Lysobacter sp. CA196]|uniref:polysaccharide deacetylase family protein n=1 Tax=Lysobacter sp. CA196 TaxID=3455606 RepID=UPI003F8D0105
MRPLAPLPLLVACLFAVVASWPSLAGAAADAPERRDTLDRRIVMTVDDLPWAQLPSVPSADAIDGHRRLVAAIERAGVPAIGFVNEGKLEHDGQVQPERLAMLRDWLDAGAELGNHSHGHLDLHEVGLPAYQADILRGERQLRPVLQRAGREPPRWFRHPYLRAGRSAQDKADLQRFLAGHGYRIAPVTADNTDWIWATAYLRVGESPDGSKREARKLKAKLRRDYVQHMGRKLDYYERQSTALLGYALPQIWLIHANLLNADTYGELVAMVRKRGYRFVGLDEAMRDPAFERADAYLGPAGPSWLHRWAIGEHRPASFFVGEPQTPAWVMKLAEIESE